MAKLYFYYSAMNAGKSTLLLQSAYNYKERGIDTLLFMPKIAVREANGKIYSRIGLSADAIVFDEAFDLFTHTKNAASKKEVGCVLVDEAQFLNKEHVFQLSEIVDQLNIPVLTYGIRSDFRAEPFTGSLYLLLWADNLIEIKTICHCGKKAILNVRLNAEGEVVSTGSQIQIGSNETYIPMCRKHFKELTQEERV